MGKAALKSLAILFLVLALQPMGWSTAAAGEMLWKLALGDSLPQLRLELAEELAARLNAHSQGSCSVEIFTADLLGSEMELLNMVQNGSLELAVVNGQLLENWNPDFSVFNLPCVFKSPQQQLQILADPALTGELYQSTGGLGIEVLAALYSGAEVLCTVNTPLRSSADLAGLRLGTGSFEPLAALMRQQGAAPYGVTAAEALKKLQLDGATLPLEQYFSQAFYELAPHLSLSNHLLVPDYVVVNAAFLNSLDAETQELLRSQLGWFVTENLARVIRLEEQLTESAALEGVQLYDPGRSLLCAEPRACLNRSLTYESQRTLLTNLLGPVESEDLQGEENTAAPRPLYPEDPDTTSLLTP
ncbi:MAG: TRAP transporter substrate-binding protein DctP [Succinivibrio sp.]|nr:TRAP transporter substrate-binding protein DctP [Succinivibrio sp.]